MTLAQFISSLDVCSVDTGLNVDVFHSGSHTSSGPNMLCVCEELGEAFSVMSKYKNKTGKY